MLKKKRKYVKLGGKEYLLVGIKMMLKPSNGGNIKWGSVEVPEEVADLLVEFTTVKTMK